MRFTADLSERVLGIGEGKAKVALIPTNYSSTAERVTPHVWTDFLDEHGLGEGLDFALGRGGLSDLLLLFFEILSMAPAIDLEKGDHYELKFVLQTGQIRETGRLADVKVVNGRKVAFFETTVAIPVPKGAGVGASLLPIKETGPRFAYLQVKRQLDVATGKLLRARASFLRGVPRTSGTITLERKARF